MTSPSLYLELTSKCNLRCPYCFNFSNEGPVRHWTAEKLLTVIQQARKLLVVEELILSGGEVLLHPYWQQIVDYGRSLGLKVSLITNGIAVTEPIISFLRSRQMQVTISLGGTCEEEDAPLRGRNAWLPSVKGLAMLGQSGIRPGLTYIIHRCNLNSAQRAVELAVAHQVAWLRFSLIRKLGRAELHWDSIGLSLTERLLFLQEYTRLKHPPDLDVTVVPDSHLESLTSFFDTSSNELNGFQAHNRTEICLRFDGTVELKDKRWKSWEAFWQEQIRYAHF